MMNQSRYGEIPAPPVLPLASGGTTNQQLRNNGFQPQPGYFNNNNNNMMKQQPQLWDQPQQRGTPNLNVTFDMESQDSDDGKGCCSGIYGPLSSVDDILGDDKERIGLYKKLIVLSLLVFGLTIAGFVVTCVSFNFLGFLHILPTLFPTIGGKLINTQIYAPITVFTFVFGIISLFAGFASECALEAGIVHSMYLVPLVAIMYILDKYDPSLRKNWNEIYLSLTCRGAANPNEPMPKPHRKSFFGRISSRFYGNKNKGAAAMSPPPGMAVVPSSSGSAYSAGGSQYSNPGAGNSQYGSQYSTSGNGNSTYRI